MLSFKTYTHVKKQKRNGEFFSFLLLTDVFKAEAGRKIKILKSFPECSSSNWFVRTHEGTKTETHAHHP